MIDDAKLRLSTLFESFNRLESFTSVDLAFLRYVDSVPILELVGTLKASNSLIKPSLSLEKCELESLNELFSTLTEMKSLRNSEILLEECEFPNGKTLRTMIPFIEEFGQNANVTLIFKNYRHIMTRHEREFFTKSLQKIKSPHKIQVQFIERFRIALELKSLFRECLTSYRDMKRSKKIFALIMIDSWIGFIIFCICMGLLAN